MQVQLSFFLANDYPGWGNESFPIPDSLSSGIVDKMEFPSFLILPMDFSPSIDAWNLAFEPERRKGGDISLPYLMKFPVTRVEILKGIKASSQRSVASITAYLTSFCCQHPISLI